MRTATYGLNSCDINVKNVTEYGAPQGPSFYINARLPYSFFVEVSGTRMRVLLIDHDAAALEKVARALRGVVELDCVTTKADGLMLLKQKSFDVLIACERAADGSGLDLLGRIGKSSGDLKRVFAAAPERLQLLGTRLQPFNVTRTISYPIDLEELWLALAAVTTGEDPSIEGTIEHIVMDGSAPTSPRANRTSSSTTTVLPSLAGQAAAQPQPPAQPAVAVATGAAARKIATESEPEPVRRGPPAPAQRTAAAPATAAPPPRAPQAPPPAAPAAQRPAPAQKPAPAPAPAQVAPAPAPAVPPRAPMPQRADAKLSDAIVTAAVAAETGERPALPPQAPAKKPPFALIGGGVALVALIVTAAALLLREPAQPVSTSAASNASADSHAATAAKATPDADANRVAALENRIEEALMRDDIEAATAAQAELAAIAPTHPRLAFFAASLKRAAELNDLSRESQTTPMAGTDNPARAPARAAVDAPPATANAPAANTTPPTQANAAPAAANRVPAESATDTRAASTRTRSENAKFQGRTLEEGAAARQRAGAAAAVPAPALDEVGPSPAPAAVVPPQQVDAKLVKRVTPEYPADAATRGIEGFATVEFTVTVEGKVIDARVVESEPRRTFDSAARDAVRRWRFEPATQGGAPIASTSRVRLEFRLKD